MDVRLLFPNDYIKAADLRGNDVPLTIATAQVEWLRTTAGKEDKLVLTFEETKKYGKGRPHKLVCNKTNAYQIAKVVGNYEIEEWTGKRITLYQTTCQAFGDTVDCIRVRDTAPSPKAKDEPVGEPEQNGDIPITKDTLDELKDARLERELISSKDLRWFLDNRYKVKAQKDLTERQGRELLDLIESGDYATVLEEEAT